MRKKKIFKQIAAGLLSAVLVITSVPMETLAAEASLPQETLAVSDDTSGTEGSTGQNEASAEGENADQGSTLPVTEGSSTEQSIVQPGTEAAGTEQSTVQSGTEAESTAQSETWPLTEEQKETETEQSGAFVSAEETSADESETAEPSLETEASGQTEVSTETEAFMQTEFSAETEPFTETESSAETEAPAETEVPAETEAPAGEAAVPVDWTNRTEEFQLRLEQFSYVDLETGMRESRPAENGVRLDLSDVPAEKISEASLQFGYAFLQSPEEKRVKAGDSFSITLASAVFAPADNAAYAAEVRDVNQQIVGTCAISGNQVKITFTEGVSQTAAGKVMLPVKVNTGVLTAESQTEQFALQTGEAGSSWAVIVLPAAEREEGRPESETEEQVSGESESETEEQVSGEPESETEEQVSSEPESETEEQVSGEPESETEGQTNGRIAARVMRRSRAVNVQKVTVTASDGGASMEKVWQDNNAANRPDLLANGWISIYYILDGDVTTKTKLSVETMAGIGLSELPEPLISENTLGVGYSEYWAEGLPSLIRTADDEEKVVSYVIEENKEEITNAGYTQTIKDGKVYNIRNTEFGVYLEFKVGTLVPEFPTGGMVLKGIANGETVYTADLSEADWTKSGPNSYILKKDLPEFTAEGAEIEYQVVVNEAVKAPDPDTGDYYVVDYENADSSNHGTDADACYNGGLIRLTRAGEITYNATKEWKDDNSAEAIASRPTGTLRLWRYIDKRGNDYRTASRVMVGGNDVVVNLDTSETTYAIRFYDSNGTELELPKYDPDGYPYVYLVRESMNGGEYEQEIVHRDENPQDNNSIYIGDTIINRRTGGITVKAEKIWIAAAEQGALKNVELTMELLYRKKGSEEEWQTYDLGNSGQMNSFSNVITSDTVSQTVARYDKDGIEYEYCWREGALVFDGQTVFDKDSLPEDGRFTMNGEQYVSEQKTEKDENGNLVTTIVNRLVGQTDYHIVKKWFDENGSLVEGPDDVSLGVDLFSYIDKEQERKCLEVYLEKAAYTSTAEVTVNGVTTQVTIQNNGLNNGEWSLDILGLPLFDENGYKCSYDSHEIADTEGWYLSNVEYDTDEDGHAIVTYSNKKGTNTPVRIKVQKIWHDDGDVKYRGPVTVGVYNKVTGKKCGEVTLNVDHNWWRWFVIELAPGEVFKREDYEIREEEITVAGKTFTPGNSFTNEAGEEITLSDQQIATDTHVYNITYSMLEDFSGEEVWTVTNTRFGYVDYTVEKIWVDEGIGEEDRPSAELVLSCDNPEYLQNIKQGGSGYFEAESIVYNGKTIPMTQTVSKAGKSGTTVSYSFTGLPKYDSTGKVIHYQVTERWSEGTSQGDYKVGYSNAGYQYGRNDHNDRQSIVVKNILNEVKKVEFHKVWCDTYSYVAGKRPDIYLRLYQSNPDDPLNPVYIAEYKAHVWKEDHSLGAETENASRYMWVCEFNGLPKYDDEGRVIHYYAQEVISAENEASDFDYVPVECYADIQAIKEGQKYSLGDNVGLIPEGGYFVNRLQKQITLSGRKLWKNVPANFPTEEFPEISVTIVREALKGAGTGEILENSRIELGEAVFATYGRIEGTNEFVFTISGYRDSQGTVHTLPKYDDHGRMYRYTLEETVLDAEGEIYKNPVTNSFTIVNEYNRETSGSLQAEKTWENVDADGVYPAATFILEQRYPKRGTAGSYSDWTEVERITISSGQFKANPNQTVTFDGLPVYAPNMQKYQYRVTEQIDGYTTVVSPESVELVKISTAGNGGTAEEKYSAAVTLTNTYTPGTAELTGTKVWDDYSNAFNTRPDEAALLSRLTLYQYADAQPGENNAVAPEKVDLQTTDSGAAGYFQWIGNDGSAFDSSANTWKYKVANLEKYAQNGMPWKYRLEESTDPNSAYNKDMLTAEQQKVDEAGNVTMAALTNQLAASFEVKKNWANLSSYVVRHMKVTVKLQVRKAGDTQWQDARELFAEQIGKIGAGSFATEKVIEASGTAVFPKLPAGTYVDGVWKAYEYRGVETTITDAVGNTELILNLDAPKDGEGGSYTIDSADSQYSVGAVTADGKTTITNTLKGGKTDLIIRKNWADSGNRYNTRDESAKQIRIRVMRSADGGSSYSPVQGLVWNWNGSGMLEAKDLPLYGPDGKAYQYSVEEITGSGQSWVVNDGKALIISGGNRYEITYSASGVTGGEITVTNTLSPTITVNAKKSWEGNSVPNGASVTLELLRDGKSFNPRQTITLDGTVDEAGESVPWTATWTGVPQYHYNTDGNIKAEEIDGCVYTVREVTPYGGYYAVYGTEPDTVAEAVTNKNLTVTNNKTKFSLDKVSSEKPNKQLNGVTLTIYKADENGAATDEVAAVWERVSGSQPNTSETWITVGAGERQKTEQIVGLPVGRYVLQETSVPYYYLTAESIPFTIKEDGTLESTVEGAVSADGLKLTMTDVKIRGHVELTKTIAGNADGTVSGIAFTLYRQVGEEPQPLSDTVIATELQTNEVGIWKTKGNSGMFTDPEDGTQTAFADGLPQGTYYFVETETGADTVLNNTAKHFFTIDAASHVGNTSAPKAVSVVNQPFTAEVTLKKIDAVSGDPVSGAEFRISYSAEKDGTYVEESGLKVTTNAQGAGSFTAGKKGFYKIEETANPGYLKSSWFSGVIQITDADAGQTIDLTKAEGRNHLLTDGQAGTLTDKGIGNARKTGRVSLTKADFEDTSVLLNGVSFSLWKKKTIPSADGQASVVEYEQLGGSFYTGKSYSSAADTSGTNSGNGVLAISGLEWGNYKLVESETLAGYAVDRTELAFTIDREHLDETVSNTADRKLVTNTMNRLTVKKAAAGDGQTGLPGAVFALLNTDETPVKDSAGQPLKAATGDDGTVTFTGKLTGGTEYILREISAPDGYELKEGDGANDIRFTMTVDGQVQVKGAVQEDNTVTVEDTPIEVLLRKVDPEGRLITDSNAVFALYDGQRRIKEVTTSDGSILLNESSLGEKLKRNTTYTLKEVTAPAGYELAEEVTFTIDSYGKIEAVTGAVAKAENGVVSVTVTDRLIALSLEKQDFTDRSNIADKEPDRGAAEFTVTGEFVKAKGSIAVTSLDMSGLTGELIPGKVYTMTETKAPAGYILPGAEADRTFTFVLGTDGKISRINDRPVNEIGDTDMAGVSTAKGLDCLIVRNRPITVTLLKTAVGGTTSAEGRETPDANDRGYAEFTVQDKAGYAFADGTMKKEGITSQNIETELKGLLIVGHTYTLTETKAPNGYELRKTETEFTVNADGTINSQADSRITVEDTPIAVQLKKISAVAPHKELSGAEFQVSGTFASAVQNYITVNEQNPDALTGELIPGEVYTIEEITAPDGYKLEQTKVTFVVDVYGEAEIKSGSSIASADNGERAVTVKFQDEPIQISLVKKDYVSSDAADSERKGLSGVAFTLYDVTGASEKAAEVTTDEDGRLSFSASALIQNHTYELYEHTYAGYQNAEAPQLVFAFKVKTDGTVEKVKTGTGTVSSVNGSEIELQNKRLPARITISKTDTDANGNTPLAGAEFTLYVKSSEANHEYGDADKVSQVFNGTTIRTEDIVNPVTTDENGAAAFTQLPWGTYLLVETKAPNGYTIPETDRWEITIGPDGSAIAVVSDRTIVNQKNRISFQKYSGNTPLSGAGFVLKPAAGSRFAINEVSGLDKRFEAVSTAESIRWRSVSDLAFTLEGYLIAGNTYVLEETAAPDGYEKTTASYSFTVEKDGTIRWTDGEPDGAEISGGQIRVQNTPITLELVKKCADTNAGLDGAEFRVEAQTGEEPAWTTVVEKAVTGQEGKLSLANSDGNVWLKQKTRYRLTETKAPAGYVLSQPNPSVEFTVAENGTVVFAETDWITGTGSDTFTVKNQKTELRLNKVENEHDGAYLAGAVMEIYAAGDFDLNEGAPMAGKAPKAEWISGGSAESGTVKGLLTGQDYVLYERTPVGGYDSFAPVVFYLAENGQLIPAKGQEERGDLSLTQTDGVYTIIMTDTRIRGHVELTKTVAGGTGDVANVGFALYRQKGNTPDREADEKIAENLRTDANGKWKSAGNTADRFADTDGTRKPFADGLPTGTYYFVETAATADTALDGETVHSFAITDSDTEAHGAVKPVSVTNQPFKTAVTLKKIDEVSKAGISGAVFTIRRGTMANGVFTEIAGEAEQSFVTGTDGTGTSPELSRKGYYRIEETENTGYAVDSWFSAVIEVTDADHNQSIDLSTAAGQSHVTGVVSGKLTGLGIENTRVAGTVTLKKVDAQDAAVQLQGVGFTLWRQDETAKAFVQVEEDKVFYTGRQYAGPGADGILLEDARKGELIIGGLEWGDYELREISTIPGYVNESKTVAFTVDREHLVLSSGAVTNSKNRLTIKKTEAGIHTPLAGAEFAVLSAAGEELSPEIAVETGADGTVTITGKLTGGTAYILRETAAPDGYELKSSAGANDILFTMTADGKVVVNGEEQADNTITVENEPITLKLMKQGETDGTVLGGAEFTVEEKQADSWAVMMDKAVTAQDGTLVFANTSAAVWLKQGAVYRLTETKAPAGYVLPDPNPAVEFTVEEDGTVTFTEADWITGSRSDTFTVKNRKTRLGLNKVENEHDGAYLADAVLEIYDAADFDLNTGKPLENKAPKADWTSGGNAEGGMIEELEVPQDYVLYERRPVSGYDSFVPVAFRMAEDGTVTLEERADIRLTQKDGIYTITMTDTRIRGHVELTKTVAGGEGDVAKVAFALYRQTGETPDREKDEQIAENLLTDEAGKWSSRSNETDRFMDTDGTEKAFAVGLPAGTYYFAETRATADTALDTQTVHPFVIMDSDTGAHGAVCTVAVENLPFAGQIELTKLDAVSLEGVEGVEFTLSWIPEYGTQEDVQKLTGTTAADGKLSFDGLPKGSYTLTETRADGYDLNGVQDGQNLAFAAEFVLDEKDNGKTLVISSEASRRITLLQGSWNAQGITNERLPGSVTMHKVDGSGKHTPLRGAEFMLMKQNDTGEFEPYLKHLLTGNRYTCPANGRTEPEVQQLEDDGELTVAGLEWGTYKLVETRARDGYRMTDEQGQAVETAVFTISRTSEKQAELGEVTNSRTALRLRKTDMDGKALAGAVFALTGKYVGDSGKAVDGTREIKLDENGEALLEGVLIGGETYTLEETVPPEGYVPAEPVQFTASVAGELLIDGIAAKDDVITVADDTTKVTVSKVDAMAGRELDGAELVIRDSDGQIVKSWTSGREPLVLEGVLIAGETYTLEETAAPEGYVPAGEPVVFTVGTDGEMQTVTLENARKEGDASLEVTKVVLCEGRAMAVDYTFYAALFSDEACEHRVSEVAALELEDAYMASAVFERLAYGTYYVAETDENGDVLNTDDEFAAFQVEVRNKKAVLSEENPRGYAELVNTFRIPDGFYKDGHAEIIVNKAVMQGGEPVGVEDTFYFALFADEERTMQVSDVAALEMDGVDSASVSFERLPYGVYYLSETDEWGFPVDETFGYTVEIDEDVFHLYADGETGEATVVNLLEEEETEPPTEPETEPPTEPETEAPTEPETEPPTEPETEAPTEPETERPTEVETERQTEAKQTETAKQTESGKTNAAKTLDPSRTELYLGLLGVSAAVLIAEEYRRRRKKKAKR